MDNETNNSLPGGETLNDRLRRAAAMARQRTAVPGVDPEAAPEEAPEAPARSEASGPQGHNAADLRARIERDIEREERDMQRTERDILREEAAPRGEQPQPRHAHRRPDEEYVETTTLPAKSKKLITWISALGALLALAVVGIVLLSVKHTQQAAEQQQQIEQLQLANEQMQLANEYDALNNEFAQYENQTSLLANDSIVQKYSAARAQVEKLLQELKNEKNKSAAQIKKLQDEIGTLKGILRQYVEQINQLNQENQELRTENQEVKAQNQQLSQNIQTVTASNKVLNERMTLAEKLNVTGVNLTALNKKGRTEKNVTKARQLMVTFTIPQNNSTPVGGTFQFEGSNIAATARKSIEYAGEEIGGITVYWDVNTTLTPGDYTVELFCDNYRLASRRFTLKK